MKYSTVKDCAFSALSLGTVQLGLNYGLNQTEGKPDRATAFGILDYAKAHGVNWLDTAAAYGDSEEVLGEWMKGIAPAERPMVATKVNSLNHSSLTALRQSLREQVALSKKRLGLEQIPLLMIHHCEEYFDDPENMRQVFKELKEDGEILFSGMSAYAFHDYGKIADSGFDAVQIPVNLFDWRQIDNGGVERLRQAGMIVFARSVFLQGLVFRKPEQLDPRMAFCADTLRHFSGLCEKYNMSAGALAISFALTLPGITSLAIGCRNESQIRRTIEQMDEAKLLTPEQMEEIRQAYHCIDERVITPTMWWNS